MEWLVAVAVDSPISVDSAFHVAVGPEVDVTPMAAETISAGADGEISTSTTVFASVATSLAVTGEALKLSELSTTLTEIRFVDPLIVETISRDIAPGETAIEQIAAPTMLLGAEPELLP